MPLAAPPRRSVNSCEQVQRITELITGQDVNKNNVDTELPIRVAEEDLKVDDGIDESDLWLVKYDDLAQKSADIPLSHLGCCKVIVFHEVIKTLRVHCHQEGADLFSDLCMWVDINQQYVDLGLFPQWDDIARS